MVRDKESLKQIGWFLLLGTGLAGIALFTPDAGRQSGVTFIRLARQAEWGSLFNWGAAWCSLKIVFLSLGFFFIIDSLGTLLVKMQCRTLATTVFLLHLVPFLGMLMGSYYLLKSLL